MAESRAESLEGKVFRDFFRPKSTQIIDCIATTLPVVADTLYSAKLIPKTTKDKAVLASPKDRYDAASQLMITIESLADSHADGADKYLIDVCHTLSGLQQHNEILADIATSLLHQYHNLDVKEDSLFLPSDPPDLKDETKVAKTTSCLQLFGTYFERFRDAISIDETTCNDFVTMLRTEQLISIAEKDIADRMTHLNVKTNMLLRAITSLLTTGMNPEVTLRKVILIAESYDHALFEDITQDMNCNPEFLLQDKVKLFSKKTDIQHLSSAIYHDHETPCESPQNFNESIRMFSEQLKTRYQCEKAPDAFDSLLPVSFIEPVMIELDPFNSHNILNSNIETIKANAKTVSMDDLGSIPRGSRYLIESSPGFGKTKVAFELRDRWVNGRALFKYSIFLLVQLRYSDIQNNICLSSHDPKDFIKRLFMSSEHWNEEALKTIIDSKGDGLFILLEGYNELKKKLVNESMLIDIITGRFFPKATVVVTSQPLNTSRIKRVTNNLHNVKVIGFDKAAVDQFIAASLDETKRQYFQYLPQRIYSCLYIPIILRLLTVFFKKETTPRDSQVSPFNTITKLYQSLVDNWIFHHSCPEDSTKSVTESDKLDLSRLAWKWISNNEFSFETETPFETLGLMQKEHCYSKMKDVKYSFLHVTIQEFLAANFVATKFPDRVKEVFQKCSCHPQFSGTLIFLAGLMPQREDLYLQVPKSLHKFDILHQLHEAQCNKIITTDSRVKVKNTYPTSHDMLALGYCIGKSCARWSLVFTLRSLSKKHIEMLAEGLGADPKGKIEELNLSLNELGCEGMTALLKLPKYIFKPITILNLRGCGLTGEKTSMEIAKFIASLPSLKEFTFHENLFDMEKNEQLPVIEAICHSKSLFFVKLSNLSPKECQALLSHKHKEPFKRINLYQLHFDSILSGLESLTKSSINTLKICDSHFTPLHSRILPDKLHTPVTSIKILDLSNCAIDDETLEYIRNAIVIGKVKRLSLNDNLITDNGCPSIIQMINSKRLKFLKLQRNKFGKDTACRIASAVNTEYLELHLSLKWKPFIDINGILFD